MSEHEIVPGEDRDQEIADLYNSGMTPAEIARKIGWTANRVGRRVQSCRKCGMVEVRSARYQAEMRNAEIEIYLAAKKSDEEIAKLMNMPLDEARKRIKYIRALIRRKQRREERRLK
jgi:DNA-directed RNA polymerase specialized sigma24 family protein